MTAKSISSGAAPTHPVCLANAKSTYLDWEIKVPVVGLRPA